MIPFFIISSIVTPLFIWLIVFFKLLPPNGWSKSRARLDLILCTLKHGGFYTWLVWAAFWIITVLTIGF